MSPKVFFVSPEAPLSQLASAAWKQRQIKSGGIRLGILDNAKAPADRLLEFLVEIMRTLVPVASVVSLRKNHPSEAAPKSVLDQLATEADFVVSAMAD